MRYWTMWVTLIFLLLPFSTASAGGQRAAVLTNQQSINDWDSEGGVNGMQNAPPQYSQNNITAALTNNLLSMIIQKFDKVIGYLDRPEKPSNEDVEEKNLSAAQDVALYTKELFYATCGSIGVSFLALVGLLASLSQTRMAMRDNLRIGEAQTQAYVQAISAQLDIEKDSIKVIIENCGQSPAKTISLSYGLDCLSKRDFSEKFKIEKMPGSVTSGGVPANIRDYQVDLDISIFGNKIRDYEESLDAGKKDLLVFVGEIFYTDVFNNYFKSEFRFMISESRSGNFGIPPHLVGQHLKVYPGSA